MTRCHHSGRGAGFHARAPSGTVPQRSRYACAPTKGALSMRLGISLGGILLIILVIWLLFGRG
jgi:hypothetical protein